MNAGVKANLTARLEKISTDKFDVDDLRLLLIDLRQFLKNRLLRDIADYVAHAEGRSPGLSHNEIDLNRWRARRVANSEAPLPITP